MTDAAPLILHATAVSVQGQAVLITGTAGSGKSSLALEMMARGAGLVADDRVLLTRAGKDVMLDCPDALIGMIEARGIGLLHAEPAGPARLCLVVDLDQTETSRYPEPRSTLYLDRAFPLLHKVESPHFPAAILQYLRHGGRVDGHP